MEEIFCMEWNMEEIFRYGMEDGMEKNCRYGIWKNRLPFHSITCPVARNVFALTTFVLLPFLLRVVFLREAF